ncbi:MAG: DNA methyltransferase, partial [Planctomycetota bacterium]
MATDPDKSAQFSHQEWLGYVQPVGLVVSSPALLAAGAYVNKNAIPRQREFLECVSDVTLPNGISAKIIADFPAFTQRFLEWEPRDLVGALGADPLPTDLEVVLTDYHVTLRPTYAVRSGGDAWMMLIQSLPLNTDFDAVNKEDHHWEAAPQARFERLLKGLKVPIGLLFNGTALRLVYAPGVESSGHITFRVQDMTEVSGRPILAALHMLLNADRLFTAPDNQRLPALLTESRKYQNHVSTELAKQVLAALYELVHGFQAADEARKGELLRDVLARDPNHVYAGLLTVLMRLVFILYAEDRGLLSQQEVFVKFYALGGLFERLRADAGRYADTMDQRYGAWAQLLALFRMIHDGAAHGALQLPVRQGYLFSPDRYPLLEGRTGEGEQGIPRVSDGVVYRVLQNLLILDGERLSYRTLDVEQIGSVYETMMGFLLQVAQGRSIAIKPKKAHGAPVCINLDALLAVEPGGRAKWLKEHTDQDITGDALAALKAAKTQEDAAAALEKKIAKEATPTIVAKGAMVLQPSDERRRSGSHYTPRVLTRPIVETTLRPIFEQMGPNPTPMQILALKICDPAMGSGAFLVEACRQLGEALVRAWAAHKCTPKIPPDEDAQMHAQRLVAQTCLYGVDKNPMAVDLAKLSLWLATLAKDHPFTFLDHALRHGDSLVGLSKKQILAFHWDLSQAAQDVFGLGELAGRLKNALAHRRKILAMPEDNPFSVLKKREELALSEVALSLVRQVGDAAIAAFFNGRKDAERKDNRQEYVMLSEAACKQDVAAGTKLQKLGDDLRKGPFPLSPFHWEIEFPEVFERENPGFDAMVGNPPFAGRTTLSESNCIGYMEWITTTHPESHGNSDLVAHFFRRAFTLLRQTGCFGLIATKTICQGDTRFTGLRWICNHGGTIYGARKRHNWPGQAAVVVSIVWVTRAIAKGPFELNGRKTPLITAYLFHTGGHESPAVLHDNSGKSFQGSVVVGMGFTFDDNDTKGVANSLSVMHELIKRNPRNAERIFPYLGGEEVNDTPTQAHNRYIFNLTDLSEEEAQNRFPDLLALAETRVKPERQASYREKPSKDKEKRVKNWWQFARHSTELYTSIAKLKRVLAVSRVSDTCAFIFLSPASVYSVDLILLPMAEIGFGILQSRIHESWARFHGSSMKDDLRYSPTDCFETFPFPKNFESNGTLEAAGIEYYEFRAALMVRNNEGLT